MAVSASSADDALAVVRVVDDGVCIPSTAHRPTERAGVPAEHLPAPEAEAGFPIAVCGSRSAVGEEEQDPPQEPTGAFSGHWIVRFWLGAGPWLPTSRIFGSETFP